MKRLFILMAVMLFLAIDVNAYNNKLYFTEKDDRLYYDTDSFDDSVFMHHLDMLPGKTFIDELTIENKTKTPYSLYLKVKNVEQDELADELIDNIEMEIYLDNVLIYEGYARGLDYSDNGVDLQNAILIGEYKTNSESKLTVYTKLSESYSNINNDSLGQIEWEFYASYENAVIPVLPNTGDDIYIHIVLLVVSSITLALLVFKLEKKKTNEG